MSIQSDLCHGWSNDGYQWPEWMDRYDEPVVRATTNGRKKMHAPDLGADEPRPACEIGGRENNSFVGAERENIEGIYVECRRPECQEHFNGGGA